MKTDPNVQKWDVQILTVRHYLFKILKIVRRLCGVAELSLLIFFSSDNFRSVEIKDIWIKLLSSDSGKFLTSK